MPTLRPYRPEDREALVALFDGNVPRYFALGERASFLQYLDAPRGRFGVLEEDGAIVGCGGILVSPQGTDAHLVWGLIARDHQGRGLGSWLTRERLRWIAAMPAVKQVHMDTSQHTVGFYEKLGFQRTMVREDYYGPGLDRYDLVLPVNREFRALYGGNG